LAAPSKLESRTDARSNRSREALDVLNGFLADVSEAIGAFLSTADGHSLLKVEREKSDPQRVAAISSSILALGERFGSELEHQQCKHVLVETEKHLVLVQRVPTPSKRAILATVAESSITTGLFLSTSRRCAENLSRVLGGK
jgi:predicted regulator of Ras-like GTPase activity (Roadblock/LC7/MglB family)